MNLKTFAYLLLPPIMWASNAVIGRFAVATAEGGPLISPVLFNFLRWTVAVLLLLVLVRESWQGFALAKARWRIFAVIGFLAITCYNMLQYLALETSTAINVTLIASSGPVWTLILGVLFFGEQRRWLPWLGAAFSLAGVAVVMSAGDLHRLSQLHFNIGDLYITLAIALWSAYTWLLRKHRPEAGVAPFLMAQTLWGLVFAAPMALVEWGAGDLRLSLSTTTLWVVLWVAIGPALLAYWCWDRGVARAGPIVASFFVNLTPLFAGVMSQFLLGESPKPYHGAALALLIQGIWLSNRAARSA